jgi:hypothetical protein
MPNYILYRHNATVSSAKLLPDCIAVSSSESNYCILNNPPTFLDDALQHGLALIEDLAVGEADDGVAQFV